MREVESNGIVFEFPDETPNEVVARAIRSRFGIVAPQPTPPEPPPPEAAAPARMTLARGGQPVIENPVQALQTPTPPPSTGSVMDSYVSPPDASANTPSPVPPMRQPAYQDIVTAIPQMPPAAVEQAARRPDVVGTAVQTAIPEARAAVERVASGQNIAAPTPVEQAETVLATPPKPDGGQLMEDVGAALRAAPRAIPAALEAFRIGGAPEDVFSDPAWGESAVAEARRDAEEASKLPNAKQNYVDFLGIKVDRQAVRTIPQNLAFSVVSMGASLLGGLGAGIVGMIGGPGVAMGARVAGAGAAGGVAAYRMDTNGFMHDLRRYMDKAAQDQMGRPLTDKEFVDIAQAPEMQAAAKEIGLAIRGSGSAQELARAHGLYEAVPEAAGNLIMLGAGKYIIKEALKGGFIKPALAVAGGAAGEVATEVPTQMGQTNTEIRAGISRESPREWTSAADWWKSFEEVAGPTLLTTGLMGGAGGAVVAGARGVERLDERFRPGAAVGRALEGDIAERGFTPASAGERALTSLSPEPGISTLQTTKTAGQPAVPIAAPQPPEPVSPVTIQPGTPGELAGIVGGDLEPGQLAAEQEAAKAAEAAKQAQAEAEAAVQEQAATATALGIPEPGSPATASYPSGETVSVVVERIDLDENGQPEIVVRTPEGQKFVITADSGMQLASTATGLKGGNAPVQEGLTDGVPFDANSVGNALQGQAGIAQLDSAVKIPGQGTSRQRLGVDPATKEGLSNGGRANVVFPGQSVDRPPTGAEASGLDNIPSGDLVQRGMRTSGQDRQVGGGIIQPVSVPVVDNFIGKQGPAEQPLSDNSVLENVPIPAPDNAIETTTAGFEKRHTDNYKTGVVVSPSKSQSGGQNVETRNARPDQGAKAEPIPAGPLAVPPEAPKIANSGRTNESAIRSVADAEELIRTGELAQSPELAEDPHRTAGRIAIASGGNLDVLLGVQDDGKNRRTWFSVNIGKDGRIYDGTRMRWFEQVTYIELVGFDPVYRMTGEEVQAFGREKKKFPDQSTLQLKGGGQPIIARGQYDANPNLLKGDWNAAAIRGDQEQAGEGGEEGQPEVQPSPVPSGGNLQREAPKPPDVVGPPRGSPKEDLPPLESLANLPRQVGRINGKPANRFDKNILKRMAEGGGKNAEAAQEELNRRAEIAGRERTPAQKTAAERAKRVDIEKDSLLAAIAKMGGIDSSLKLEVGFGSGENKWIPGVGQLFRVGGNGLDNLAVDLSSPDLAFMLDYELESDRDNGGVNLLTERIRNELGGKKHWSFSSTKYMQEERDRAQFEAEQAAQGQEPAEEIPEDQDEDERERAALAAEGQIQEGELDDNIPFSRVQKDENQALGRLHDLIRVPGIGNSEATVRWIEKPGTEDAAIAEEIAKTFGKTIIWVEFGGGFSMNGVMLREKAMAKWIFVSIDTKHPYVQITGHELVHHLRQDRPDLYKQLHAQVSPVLINDAEFRRIYGIKLGASIDAVTEEMIGDVIGTNFTEPDFWAKVAQVAPEKFKALAEYLLQFVQKLINRFTGKRTLGAERFVSDMKVARDAIAAALAEYAPGRKFGLTAPTEAELKAREEAVKAAEQLGGEEYAADAYVAFRPEQIKSALGNVGSFDPTNPDIRFSRVQDDKQRTILDILEGRVDPMPRPSLIRGVRKIVKDLERGPLWPTEPEDRLKDLLEAVDITKEAKPIKDRQRGSLWLRERIIREQRLGGLTPEAADFALWLLEKSPQVADGLGISIRQGQDQGPAGRYNPYSRVATAFLGNMNETTAVHEILHHTERMMPEEVRDGIVNEWMRQLKREIKASPNSEQGRERVAALLAVVEYHITGNNNLRTTIASNFARGVLKYEDYQFASASEFWAVNATEILRARRGTWVQKAIQWLRELVQKAKAVFGLQSSAPVIYGLQAVLNGSGKFTAKTMLAEAKAYQQREVDYTETDEIPATEGRLEAPKVKSEAQGELDLFTATPIPGNKGAKEFTTVRIEPVKRGELRIGFEKIDTPEKAAHAFAAIRKAPMEKFQILVLDKDKKPIAHWDIGRGTVTQASVYPREVAVAVFQTPGAAYVWYGHNHPSGTPRPSAADEMLTSTIGKTVKDFGVKHMGHIIIVGTKAASFDVAYIDADSSGSFVTTFDIPPASRKFTVPVMERVVRVSRPSLEEISSPAAARQTVPIYAKNEPGLLLLDARHRVLGWWPMTVGEMGRLKTGNTETGGAALFRAIGQFNAVAAMAYLPNVGSETERVIQNVGTALSLVDVQLLDAFSPRPGAGLNVLDSFAERGLNMKGSILFSRKQIDEVAGAATEAVKERPSSKLVFDMGALAKIFVHPRTYAAFEPDFTHVKRTQSMQYQLRDEIVAEIAETYKSYRDLNDKERGPVHALLELGRLAGEVYGKGKEPATATNEFFAEAQLSKIGETITLTDRQKAAYWSVRRAMDKALDRFIAELVFEANLDPKTVKTAKQVLASIKAGMPPIEKNQLKWLADKVEEIHQAKRRGYIPFTRFGNAGIAVTKDDKTVFFDTVEAPEIDFRNWRRDRAVDKRYAEIKAEFPESKGFKVVGPFDMVTGSGAPAIDMAAFDQLMRLAQVDDAQRADIEDRMKTALKKRGFRKHFLQADNIAGYSIDFERALAEYTVGLAGYLARRRFAPQWDAAIGAIPAAKGRLTNYAREYRTYINSPVEELQFMRQTAYVYYLAAVPATAVLNLSQVPLITIPYLNQFINSGRLGIEMTRAYAAATAMIDPRVMKGANLRSAATGAALGAALGGWAIGPAGVVVGGLVGATAVKGDEIFNMERAPKDMLADIKKSSDDGFFVPLATMEMMGTAYHRQVAMRRLSRVSRDTIDALASMFTLAERHNRIVTYIAAYRLAKLDGMRDKILEILQDNALAVAELATVPEAEFARAFAEFVVLDTQYEMGKGNRPTLGRGWFTPIVQFKGFPWQTVELYARLLVGLHGNRGRVALLAMMILLLMASGLWGLPFAENLRKTIEELLRRSTDIDKDLKLEFRRLVADLTGSARVAEVASAGGFRYIDDSPDVAGRVSMGNILPNPMDPATLLGVPFDLWVKRAFGPGGVLEQAQRGDTKRAVAQAMPNFVKNWIEASAMKEGGVRSQKYGNKIVHQDELGLNDLIMKGLGARSRAIAEETESEYTKSRASHALDEMKRAYTYRLAVSKAKEVEARNAGDKTLEALYRAKFDQTRAQIKEWNKDRPAHEKIIVTAKSINNAVEAELVGAAVRNKRAPRQMRGVRAEIEELFNSAD